MELRDYLRILRKSWVLVVLCTVLATAAAATATLLMTPQYEGDVQLFVWTRDQCADNTSGLQQGAQFSQQRVKSYADIVTSPIVAQPVIDKLSSPTRRPSSLTRSAPRRRWTRC